MQDMNGGAEGQIDYPTIGRWEVFAGEFQGYMICRVSPSRDSSSEHAGRIQGVLAFVSMWNLKFSNLVLVRKGSATVALTTD